MEARAHDEVGDPNQPFRRAQLALSLSPVSCHGSVVKEIQRLNDAEKDSTSGKSWHDEYKDSAYIFVGRSRNFRPHEGVAGPHTADCSHDTTS
jgi:hypothetical protein